MYVSQYYLLQYSDIYYNPVICIKAQRYISQGNHAHHRAVLCITGQWCISQGGAVHHRVTICNRSVVLWALYEYACKIDVLMSHSGLLHISTVDLLKLSGMLVLLSSATQCQYSIRTCQHSMRSVVSCNAFVLQSVRTHDLHSLQCIDFSPWPPQFHLEQ